MNIFKKNELKEEIELPSGIKIELNRITGREYRECIYNMRKLSIQQGCDMGVIGYWEKYEEFVTGWTRKRLDSLSLDDADFVRRFAMEHSKIGPQGSNESDETRKK